MNDIKLPVGNLYVGEGVVASGIAIVPGSAVVNGRFDGAIKAKEIDIQGNGEVSGTTQAASITVTGKLNDVVQAADLLAIRSTGVVTGDVRYGNLEVSKGGELLGSMKRM